MTISLCMIVKNESENLPRCVNSAVKCVDEICIVDTGSTDNTIVIAESYIDAEVMKTQWRNDFSYHRNQSIDMATSDWILWLDADDELSDEAVAFFIKLRSQIRPPHPRLNCYNRLIIKNVLKAGTGHESYQVRLFPNRKAFRFKGPIHERVSPSLEEAGLSCIDIPVKIFHHGYTDPTELKVKLKRNLKILLKHKWTYRKDLKYVASIADSYISSGDPKKALKFYKKAEKLKGDEGVLNQIPVHKAACYKMMNKYPKAHNVLAGILAKDPDKIDALFLLGDMFFTEKEYRKAIVAYEKATWCETKTTNIPINHDGIKLKAEVNIGKCLLKLGRKDEATARMKVLWDKDNRIAAML